MLISLQIFLPAHSVPRMGKNWKKNNNFLIFGSNLMCNVAIDWIFQAGHFDICFKIVQHVFRNFFGIHKMRIFFFLQITCEILVARMCNIHQLNGLFKLVILIYITRLCNLYFANYSQFKKCAKNARPFDDKNL